MDPKFCKDALSNVTGKCGPKHKLGEGPLRNIARKFGPEHELDIDSFRDIATKVDWEKLGLESIFPQIGNMMTSPSYYTIQVMHSLQRYMREQLDDFDLTRTQLSMLASLMILARMEKVVTQMDLANFLKADKMMVSEVLRTLEKKGYIIRQNHPSDRRAKSLAVTEKGLSVLKVTMKHTVKCDEQFFSALGDDKEEYIRILKKLL